VPVGGKAVGIGYTNVCAGPVGNETYIYDTQMTFSAGGLPSALTGITYGPNPTNNGWDGESFLISTYTQATASGSATPETVSYQDIGSPVGGCPNGVNGGGSLNNSWTIVPGITGPESNPDYVWWFNGANPGPNQTDWPTKATLTLPGVSSAQGPFIWKISTGNTELKFSNGTQTMVTKDPMVVVESIKPSPPMTDHDITITVTTKATELLSSLTNPFPNNIEYLPFYMSVRQPYKWVRLNTTPNCGPFDYPIKSVVGYDCEIHYQTYDQFNDTLPDKFIPINEVFTSAEIPVYTGETWGQAKPCRPCAPKHATDVYDTVGKGTNVPTHLVPPLTVWGTSGGTAEVQYWTGQWRVGATTEPEGVVVANVTWIRYQDHGDHAIPIQSPPN
jgi:hypothetical protein